MTQTQTGEALAAEGTPVIELRHVDKHFGSLHVLKDINLKVGKGEVVVVIGPSGSGKSTLCRTINRLETIDSGEVLIEGKPLPQEGKELAATRAEIGMVFQSFNLFAHRSIIDNVTMGPVEVLGVPRDKAREEGMELLRRVGVAEQAEKMPAQLSGGQQQRCAMARILASDPELILLDEPFSALDGYLRWQLELELTDVLRGFPGGAVYVSHNRDEVYRICDTVCVLDRGRSDAKVGVRELFASPATLAAALISGCKNVSRAHVAGPGLLACDDWGVTLETSLPVPEGVTHVGIRAHYFQAHAAGDGAASAAGGNAIPCTVERVIDSTFSTIVMARTPGGALLRYECEKDAWAALGNPVQLVLVAPPQTVMPLVSACNGETPDAITLDNTGKGGAPRA